MANSFTKSSVRRTAGPEGKTYLIITGILAIDSAVGAAADDIPASLFGLNKIVDVGPIVPDSEDAIIVGAPDYTGDSILVRGVGANTLADLANDNYRLVVTGY